MTGKIIFNGTSSQDFGLVVEKVPSSVHASRRGNLISIPGRNGVIVREDGSFDTYTQEYDVWFSESKEYGSRSAYDMARDIAVWLLGASGFCRLEDDFEPEHYRLARYSGALDVDMILLQCGKARLTFDFQPQRYLKSGEKAISYEGDSSTVFSITNPTNFEARPLMKFVDTAVQPDPVEQTLTLRENYVILSDGKVRDFSSVYPGGAVSNPVNCSGKQYAFITGDGYAFYDSGGETREGGYSKTGGWSNGATRVKYRIPIPSWAATVVVSRAHGRDAQVGLSLQDPRPNPGASAVTINGITINLDFSEHDTIFLDCDLHDAYYADGSNANKMVSFRSSVVDYPTFPGLSPGENSIIPNDGAILDFELTPRWWTL